MATLSPSGGYDELLRDVREILTTARARALSSKVARCGGWGRGGAPGRASVAAQAIAGVEVTARQVAKRSALVWR